MAIQKRRLHLIYDGDDVDGLASKIVEHYLDKKGGFGCPSIPEKGCACASCNRARGAAKAALKYLQDNPN